jgi:predicted DCC family thiol-disulfide oxidoreductase YuxK
LDSVVLYDVESGVFSIKSKAVNIILKDIQKLSFITLVLKFLPLFIGDYFYDLVAKNRYLLFGKKETCLIPSEDISSKFLS